MSQYQLTSEHSARYYNANRGPEVGWMRNGVAVFTVGALAQEPDLQYAQDLWHQDPAVRKEASTRFVRAVQRIQVWLNTQTPNKEPLAIDGRLGPVTWRRLVAHFAPVANHASYHLRDKIRLAAELPSDILLRTWEHPGGMEMHSEGNFQASPGRKPTQIVLHWGGINPAHCRRALNGGGLSSHAGVGRGVIYQWLDLQHTAWHAGRPHNARSIGFDICQQPVPGVTGDPDQYLREYTEQGYDVRVVTDLIKRPGRRAFKRTLTLDPRIAATARAYVIDLCRITGIPFEAPRNAQGRITHEVLPAKYLEGFSGIIGHHHLSERKTDIDPWWEAVFEGTDLER